jgi:hypothetical protein
MIANVESHSELHFRFDVTSILYESRLFIA